MDNIYGLQQVPKTEVRTGWDVASTTSGAAAQGSSIGSSIGGPGGAVVGMVAGGIMGLSGARKAQKQEKRMRQSDEQYNKFVASMGDRALPTNNLVRAQAEHGMNASRYMVAEIEGDGKYRYGIGEIHTDKNFNIKNVAAGAPKHEQGGLSVVMEEGDVVFPTQTDETKFNKILSAIKRYKSKGDTSAKRYLEKERDSLPSDLDYGYYENGTSGINPGPWTNESWAVMQANQNYFGSIPQGNVGGAIVTQPDTKPRYSYNRDTKGDPYEYRLDENTGEVSQRKKGSSEWKSLVDLQAKGTPNTNKADKAYPIVNNDVVRQRRFPDWQPKGQAGESVEVGDTTPVSTQSPQAEEPEPEFVTTETQRVAQIDPETGLTFDELSKIRLRNNPLKSASIINNLVQGTKPAERVMRRYYNPEAYTYADRSASQRAAVLEGRNAAANMLRGKGLSIGQQQGYLGQIGSRYLGAMEGINEAEARRADQIDFANIGGINQAKQMNINLANQYDTWDAQNRAARQRYLDVAMSETAQLAQINEQRDYMIDRNRRQYDMDRVRLGYMQDMYPNFTADADNLGNIRYRRNYE